MNGRQMTIGEFKAFLDGMDIQDAPTKEQWARISERLEGLGELSYAPRIRDLGRKFTPRYDETGTPPYPRAGLL